MFSFHFCVGHLAPSKSFGGGACVEIGSCAGSVSGRRPGGGVKPGGSEGCGCWAMAAPIKSENFIFGEKFLDF